MALKKYIQRINCRGGGTIRDRERGRKEGKGGHVEVFVCVCEDRPADQRQTEGWRGREVIAGKREDNNAN